MDPRTPAISLSHGKLTVQFHTSKGTFGLVHEDMGPLVSKGTVFLRTTAGQFSSGDPGFEWESDTRPIPDGKRLLLVGSRSSGEPSTPLELIFDLMDELPQVTLTLTFPQSQAAVEVRGDVSMGPEPLPGRLQGEPNPGVFALSHGPVNGTAARSLFDRWNDTALSLGSTPGGQFVHQLGDPPDRYQLLASGPAGSQILSLTVISDIMRNQGIHFYAPIDRSVFTHAPTGWCTWYYYYQNITEEEWEKNVVWLAENLKPFGLEWVQIDDGWQADNGSPETSGGRDWRKTNRKFPRGMKWVADVAHQNGLRPGIWLIPQKTDCDEVYAANPDYFLHYPDGKPVRIADWHPAGTKMYVIDPTNPEAVKRYYRPLWKTLAHEWGFDYFKIDNQPHYSGWYADKNHIRKDMSLPGAEVYRETLLVIREVIGPNKFLLGCYGIPLDGIGIMNGSRTGGDMHASWEGCQVMIDTITRWGFLNNVAWWCDPDTLCVRSPLTLDEARVMTTLVSLSGQLLMTSDKMYELPEERVELLRRACPTVDIRPMEFYPWVDRERPAIVDLKIEKPFGRWDVAGVFNWSPTTARHAVSFSELGLPIGEGRKYHVFEFWGDRYLGMHETEIVCELPRHGCHLLAIHEATDRPQLISTSRHITQGCVDLVEVQWDAEREILTGWSRVVGEDAYTLTVFLPRYPHRFEVAEAKAEGLPVAVETSGPLARVRFTSPESTEVSWSIAFRSALSDGAPVRPEGLKHDTTGMPNPPTLRWQDSGAQRYRIYRDGIPVGEAWEPFWTDIVLAPNSSVRYTVSAVGPGGTESPRSDELLVTVAGRVDPRKLADATVGKTAPVGPSTHWASAAPDQPDRIELDQLPADRYRLRVAAVGWRNMGRMTVFHKGKKLAEGIDTASDSERPILSWVDLGTVSGDAGSLEVHAEAGPVAVLNAQRIPVGLISRWKVAGPFDNTDDKGFDTPYPPEETDEPLAAPEITWREVATDENGILDLQRTVTTRSWVLVYLYAEVTASEDIETELLIGSDDGVKAWVNGQLVHNNHVHRGLTPDQDRARVKFKKGLNRLLLKVDQGEGAWAARARILDPEGSLEF